MSAKQAVTIACRVLSVYFLAWLFTDLTYLPENFHSLLHHEGVLTAFGTTYWRDSDVLSVLLRIFRMIVLFFAVQWFYRAGPRLQNYFLAGIDED